MTHPYIPPQPGGPGAYEQQLAARARQLEQDRATLETELGQARQRNAALQQRAELAEAALSRVRAQCERWRYTPDRKRATEEMLAELDRGGDHFSRASNVIKALPLEAGNAEDCPQCSERRDLPYPFLCPGHPLAACVCTGTAAGLELCADCPGRTVKATP